MWETESSQAPGHTLCPVVISFIPRARKHHWATKMTWKGEACMASPGAQLYKASNLSLLNIGWPTLASTHWWMLRGSGEASSTGVLRYSFWGLTYLHSGPNALFPHNVWKDSFGKLSKGKGFNEVCGKPEAPGHTLCPAVISSIPRLRKQQWANKNDLEGGRLHG